MKRRSKNVYVVSSAAFLSKEAVIKQLKEWDERGSLDSRAAVYVVLKCYKPIIKRVIELKEVK